MCYSRFSPHLLRGAGGRSQWNRTLRPLLMQSDLQPVGNGAIGTFTRVFAPKMCEVAVSRLRMTWTFLQDLSRAVSRFSRCPVARNHLRYFSDPTGSNTIKNPDWIGKNVFSDPTPDRNRI